MESNIRRPIGQIDSAARQRSLSRSTIKKIGYVSPDFRDHAAGQNLWPLLEHRDRDAFEVFGYHNDLRSDDHTKMYRSACDQWRTIAAQDDDSVARMIREDKIDILLDLSQHMGGNRLLVFARKPAPVQISFIGYPGSTGLETIDCRLTDPHLDPPRSVPPPLVLRGRVGVGVRRRIPKDPSACPIVSGATIPWRWNRRICQLPIFPL